MIIAICGIDGAGKSTHIQMLKQELELKFNIYLTKQPTDFYRNYDRFKKYVNKETKSNDKYLKYELALLSAMDKIRHYDTELSEKNENNIIISDRYVFSAYSYFLSRGIDDIEWLKSINKWLPLPEITIYLDVDPQIALNRIVERDGKYTKKEETDMIIMKKVREVFLKQPWGENDNYYIVKTNDDINSVHNEIVAIINNYILRNNLGDRYANNR